MQLMIPLSGRWKVLLAAAVLILLILGGMFFFFRNGTSLGDLRLAHLEGIARILETYRERNGFYPQPAARMETLEGVKHVWGYRSSRPALASCTVKMKDGVVDPESSACGGEIYDVEGNVIGWKGTIALESAGNSVEVAGREGRLVAPLSDMLNALPSDPGYGSTPDLTQYGFGEYIYAVRMPEDGAVGKGGVQYQLAATVKDPATGTLRTFIRGDYFVRSEERGTLPPSLIGPGMLLSEKGEPVGVAPLHVLIDTQAQGYPNPLLGEGEHVLRQLSVHGKADVLQNVLERRIELLPLLPEGSAREELSSSLSTLDDSVVNLLTTRTEKESEPVQAEDLSRSETQVNELAMNVELALATYLSAVAEEAEQVLIAERDERSSHVAALSGALLALLDVEKDALFARDEILKYLDGEGIEEQARSRAGRKIENALAGIPEFSSQQLFLMEEAEKAIQELGEVEGEAPATSAFSGGTTTQTTLIPAVFALTVSQELSVLLRELRGILRDIQEDLQNPSIPMEELDDAMRRLSRALRSEMERVEGLLRELAPAENLPPLLAAFQTEHASHASLALAHLSKAMKLHGNFAPLLFSKERLENIVLRGQTGVPDVSAYEHPEEAEYQGIPYPLP
jgi:hypothetical protein